MASFVSPNAAISFDCDPPGTCTFDKSLSSSPALFRSNKLSKTSCCFSAIDFITNCVSGFLALKSDFTAASI